MTVLSTASGFSGEVDGATVLLEKDSLDLEAKILFSGDLSDSLDVVAKYFFLVIYLTAWMLVFPVICLPWLRMSG